MKLRMKRLQAVLLAGILVCSAAGLAGCGKEEAGEVSGKTQSAMEEDGSPEAGEQQEDSLPETDPVEAADVTAKPEVKTLTITATGDCTLGKTQDQSYDGSFNAYYDSYGPDYFFENVREVFSQDDLTVINLECVLTTSDDRVEKTFNLKGEPEYVSILTGSSVEACSLGNNHTYDYGESGFQETKQVLEEAGITYAYTQQPGMYTTADGVKVGIVSAGLLSQSAERLDMLKESIRSFREEGADVVIACCHWGIEKEYYPNDYQQTTAHELIDAGADLVIGNHPHVLQGVEEYNGKLILYSLGNFSFGGNKNPSDKDTMMFQQTFTIEDGEVKTDAIDARIIPCRLSSASGYNDFQPQIASGDTKQRIIDQVNAYSAPYSEVSFDSEGILQIP